MSKIHLDLGKNDNISFQLGYLKLLLLYYIVVISNNISYSILTNDSSDSSHCSSSVKAQCDYCVSSDNGD